MEHSLFNELNQIIETRSRSQLTNFIQKAVERLGYVKFAYHIIRSPVLNGGTNRLAFGLTTYSDKWLQKYHDYGYVNQDPVVDRIMVQKEAFRWSDTFKDTELDKRQTEILAHVRNAGIFDGVTVPLKSRYGEEAAFTFIAEKGANSQTDRPIGIECCPLGMECLLAEFLHGHILQFILCDEYQLNARRKKSILSPRETQVLFWASRGKSSWEISQILGIAEKSAEFYIDSAKRKLIASNRTHAVVKAMQLGLIE